MTNDEIQRKRILKIAKRMLLDGEVFYSSHSPHMTMEDYRRLTAIGFWVQSEFPHPPESRCYYMMSEKRAINLEILKDCLEDNK